MEGGFSLSRYRRGVLAPPFAEKGGKSIDEDKCYFIIDMIKMVCILMKMDIEILLFN